MIKATRSAKAAVRWLVAIVGILAVNLIAMVILMVLANRSPGEVIPDYYAKAVRYDDALDEAAQSAALGWSANVVLSATSLEVRVHDRSGAPLDGAAVRIAGYPRAHAAQTFAVTTAALGEGRYGTAVPSVARGIHDLMVTIERGGEKYVAHVAVEAQ